MSTDKIYYATFGGPGTGKTTLLKRIVNDFPRFKYSGNETITTDGTILSNYHKKIFIDDDKSYFFKFQMEVLPVRFWQMEKCENNSFVDETIYDAYAYTKAELKLKWISEEEYHTFFHNYNTLKQFISKPASVIYFRCNNLFFILSRLARRGRAIEKKFSIEYLEALFESFNEVAYEMKEDGLNILEYDITDPKISMEYIYSDIIDKLKLK